MGFKGYKNNSSQKSLLLELYKAQGQIIGSYEVCHNENVCENLCTHVHTLVFTWAIESK